MNYIRENQAFLEDYIALDVIGDDLLTWMYYVILRAKGFDPIPVYHVGSPEFLLRWYRQQGARRVALGGTVPITDKAKVAAWVRSLVERYPDIRFHLLGSSSPKILSAGLDSCDSSTWIMMAANGSPREIKGRTREAKIKRAVWNLRQMSSS